MFENTYIYPGINHDCLFYARLLDILMTYSSYKQVEKQNLNS